MNDGSYEKQEIPNKRDLVRSMLPKVFTWAREAGATQPLTSGLWDGDWASFEKLDPIQQIQLEQSDILTFHNYSKPDDFLKHVEELQKYHRPIICTEYMARPQGSTFEGILPVAKKYKVGAINWGLVAGKTQTWYPWDSWQHPYTDHEPELWFHEIFRNNGQPYNQAEANFIRKTIGPAQTL